ncbi:MAG: AMP-binding protein [Oscillospiraceae bacterium]
MDRKNYDLSHLKVINYSTCPISPDLLRRALDRLNCRFYQSYGMTEMASTVTALLPGGSPDPRRTVSHLGRTGAARRRRAHRAAGRLAVRCR